MENEGCLVVVNKVKEFCENNKYAQELKYCREEFEPEVIDDIEYDFSCGHYQFEININDNLYFDLDFEDSVPTYWDSDEDHIEELIAYECNELAAVTVKYRIPAGYKVSNEYMAKIRRYINKDIKTGLDLASFNGTLCIYQCWIPIHKNLDKRLEKLVAGFLNQNVVSLLSKIKDNLVPMCRKNK